MSKPRKVVPARELAERRAGKRYWEALARAQRKGCLVVPMGHLADELSRLDELEEAAASRQKNTEENEESGG